MASLEGSFFTGLDTGGGGSPSNFPIPANQIVYGTGPGVTSNADLTYIMTGGNASVSISSIDSAGLSGYFLDALTSGNSPQGFVAEEGTNPMGTRKNFFARDGYNPQLLSGDHAFYIETESYFNPSGDGQTEMYMEYFSTNHVTTFRPISVTIPVEGAFADIPSLTVQASNFFISSAPTTSGTVNVKFLASVFVDTGTDGNHPSDIRLRATNGSSQANDLRITDPFVEIDTRGLTGGGGLYIFQPSGSTQDPLVVNVNSVVVFNINSLGEFAFLNAYSRGFIEQPEITAPSAPGANSVRIYAQDNGAGKTQLMALFSSGAAQQIAIQP